jgi:ubiquitin carboxyl-terminal hydrolase 10
MKGTTVADIRFRTYSYFDSAFNMVTTSVIKCSCGHASKTKGHDDGSISLPIAPAIRNGTLVHYLKKYMTEQIDGYRCEECRDTSMKYRTQRISHAPEILTVQLKRFKYDGKKDFTPIIIPTTLDLNEFRDAGYTDQLHYELSAVIKHSGWDTKSGHYISSMYLLPA